MISPKVEVRGVLIYSLVSSVKRLGDEPSFLQCTCLVLKIRHLSDSTFCTRFLKLLDVPEHAVTGILLYSGLV